MGPLLALAASAAYGAGNVVASSAVHRFTASSVALWTQLSSCAMLGFLTIVLGPEFDPGQLLWGAAAGAVSALGVLAFYTALQLGSTPVVASIGATGVLIPFGAGLVAGDDVRPLALIGVIVVIIGILLIARQGPSKESAEYGSPPVPGRFQPSAAHDRCKPMRYRRPHLASLLWSFAAAAAFGAFFLVVAQADASAPGEGLGPAVATSLTVQLGSVVVTAFAATAHTIRCVRPSARLAVATLALGGLDLVGDVVLVAAVAAGPISIVGPLASLDPVVAAVIGAVTFRERLGAFMAVGIVTVLTGVLLIALRP